MTRFVVVVVVVVVVLVVVLVGGYDLPNREIRDTCIRGHQISHIQSMAASKRALTNRANVHTPM